MSDSHQYLTRESEAEDLLTPAIALANMVLPQPGGP